MFTLVRHENSKEVVILQIKEKNWIDFIFSIGGVIEKRFDEIFELEYKYNTKKTNDFLIRKECNPEENGNFITTIKKWEIFVPFDYFK